VAAVKRIGAVSPAARPILKIAPVRIPGRAVGKTTFLIVCHFVAPKAKEASLKEEGTELIASSDALIITGRMSIPRVSEPESTETPKPKSLTNIASPKSPKTTEGTPARLLMPILIIFTHFLA
jgi:hypothetical protein